MSFKSYFLFTRIERNGLIVLVSLMLSLQLCYHFVDFTNSEPNPVEKRQWLALQHQIDSMRQLTPAKPERFPFNPNFITDYKGYRLGMSVSEIDRLHAFRKRGKFVNSASEFQAVTKVSDSLLATLERDFKFPDWVANKQRLYSPKYHAEKPKIIVKDINTATKDELMAVYGIGDALSDRILKQKELLGGFVSMAQMDDVWGLQPEVVDKLKERFEVRQVPAVRKISINDASVSALAKFPYFRYALAKEIVTYRSMNGPISGIADLAKIKNFPIEKVEIIAVYLEF
jgi:DNA uptake protein ComE-like DNA-binding protein